MILFLNLQRKVRMPLGEEGGLAKSSSLPTFLYPLYRTFITVDKLRK